MAWFRTRIGGRSVNRFRIALGLVGTLLIGVLASRRVDAAQPTVAPSVPAVVPAQAPPAALAPSSAQAPSSQAPASPPAGYAGADTCVVCHTAEETSIKSSPHGNVT